MRRSGVRIPLAPPQADIRSGCRFFVCLGALVWCLLLCCSWRRWCSGRRVAYLDGPGRCVCRWAAARPRDRHTRACGSEWSISRPAWPCRHPPAPSGALHTGGAWSLMCGSARRLVVRPGLATARWHRSQALPPPAGTAAGELRETVIAFAGVCSVSGETDDTIASQIPPFSAQFWRAKASWVSWRRPEAPALVPTVTSRGAVSSMGATKFAQRSQNGPKRVFYGVPGEFFRECGWVGCLLGEFWRSPAP